jgi:hypothetical protein
VALAAAALFVCAPSAADNIDLIVQAEYVTECENWFAPSYEWLSQDRIFHLRQTDKSFAACIWQVGRLGDEMSDGFNRRTGSRSVAYKLSPDRSWALMLDGDETTPVRYRALSVDGTKERSLAFEGGEPIDFAWLPNSTEFIAVDVQLGKPFLSKYSLSASRPIWRKSLASDESPDGPSELPALLLGFTKPDRFVTCTLPTQRGQEVEICEFSLSGTEPPSVYRVEFEANAFPVEAELSPKGERIAWLVQTINISGKRTEMRLSAPDGSGMVTVGGVEKNVDAQNPSNLRWVPGGAYVSFTHRGALYAADIRAKAAH